MHVWPTILYMTYRLFIVSWLQMEKKTRINIDLAKLDHFLAFITSPHVVQDVPFGEKMMKLTTGEVLYVPNIIRTMIPSTLTRQYISYCEETSFEPLSERTLFRILGVCSASVRTSLQGLDYFTADGKSKNVFPYKIKQNIV